MHAETAIFLANFSWTIVYNVMNDAVLAWLSENIQRHLQNKTQNAFQIATHYAKKSVTHRSG